MDIRKYFTVSEPEPPKQKQNPIFKNCTTKEDKTTERKNKTFNFLVINNISRNKF